MKTQFITIKSVLLPLLIIIALTLAACEGVQQPEVLAPAVEPDTEAELGTEADLEEDVEDALEDESVVVIDEEETEGADVVAERGVSGVPAGTFVRSFALMDWDFVNQDGAVSGEIEDFFFDMNTGRIPLVSIEYGGLLEIGDTEISVPLAAFAWGTGNELVLNFDEQALVNFPDLGDNWPDVTDPAWDDEVNLFWNELGFEAAPDVDDSEGLFVQASDLRGFAIVDLGGVGPGTIYDLLIDLGEGRVQYVLVGFGTGATVAEDSYILPLEIFDFAGVTAGLGDELLFDANVTPEMLLTAPRFDRTLFGEGVVDDAVLAPGWNELVDEYWAQYLE